LRRGHGLVHVAGELAAARKMNFQVGSALAVGRHLDRPAVPRSCFVEPTATEGATAPEEGDLPGGNLPVADRGQILEDRRCPVVQRVPVKGLSHPPTIDRTEAVPRGEPLSCREGLKVTSRRLEQPTQGSVVHRLPAQGQG
jgi:hypothetical protein